MDRGHRWGWVLASTAVVAVLTAACSSDGDADARRGDDTTEVTGFGPPPEDGTAVDETDEDETDEDAGSDRLAIDASVLGTGWTAVPYVPTPNPEAEARFEECLGRVGASEHKVRERFSDRFVRQDDEEVLAAVLEVDSAEVARADLEAHDAEGDRCAVEIYGSALATLVDPLADPTVRPVDAPWPDTDAVRIRLVTEITEGGRQIPVQVLDLVLVVDGAREVTASFRSGEEALPDDLQQRVLTAALEAG